MFPRDPMMPTALVLVAAIALPAPALAQPATPAAPATATPAAATPEAGPAPTPAAPAVTQVPVVPATPPPPPVATPPAPPAAAPPGPRAPTAPLVRPYGTVRAVINVTNGVESFGNANTSAITGAVNPVFLANPGSPFLSFQVAQSRFGLMAGEGGPVKAQLEVDFIHFDQSSPTTQAFPRLRIAVVDWTMTRGHRLFLGQTWDLFSPLNTHTVNIVGNLFHAGNSGFFRHQLGYVGTFGSMELAAAVGLPGSNAGPSFSDLERAAIPTGSVRLAWRNTTGSWAGASALVTALRYQDPTPTSTNHEDRPAFGINLFADLKFGKLNLRAEAYFAQNLAGTGALTQGAGRFGTDVRDAGGWVSARYDLDPHALYLVAGGAAVLNPGSLLPGYNPATMTGMTTNPAARVGARGPGYLANAAVRLGYSFSPRRWVTFLIEPFLYVTQHKLDVANAALDPWRIGAGVEIGSLFTF